MSHPPPGSLLHDEWCLEHFGDRWSRAMARRRVIEVDDMVARAGELLPVLTEAHDRYLAALLWPFCDAS